MVVYLFLHIKSTLDISVMMALLVFLALFFYDLIAAAASPLCCKHCVVVLQVTETRKRQPNYHRQ